MKKLFTFFFSFLSLLSFAQITLFDTDFANVGDSVILARNNSVAAGISVDSAGFNSWNFSNIGFGTLDTIVFQDPALTQYAGIFQFSTEVVLDQDDLVFYVNNPGERAIDGIVTDLFNNNSPIAIDLSPNITQVSFPGSYLDTLDFTTVIDSTIDTNLFGVYDSVRFKRVYDVYAKIDGYGLITTPAGTFNSLRQYRFEDVRDTTWVHSTSGGWTLAPTNPTAFDSTHSYTWYANNENYPVMVATTPTKTGNIATATFKIGGALSASVSYKQDASCNGACDGLAFADAVGGTQPYTYQWSSNSGNQTNDTATALCAGVYNVTVYDALGDSAVTTMQINEPNVLAFDTVSVSPETGFGNDGAISTSVTGGTSPYHFIWSNGDTTQNISSLTTGNYNGTVTDNNGCIDTLSVFVPSNAGALVISLDSVLQTSCFNACDGEAHVSAAGGITPYTFQWDAAANNQSGSNATGLCAGIYSVTVYDANNDSAMLSNVSIAQPAQLVADTVSVTPESGVGNDGAIDATVQGGTPPYSYVWDNGATTQDITNLTTGSYTLTVTDQNGCTDVISVVVPSSGPVQGIIYYQTDFGTVGDQIYMARDLNPAMLNLANSGNTNWNFGNLKIQAIDTLDFIDPATTTYGPDFPNANLVIANGADTSYLTSTSSKLATQGIFGDPFGLGIQAVIEYEPELTKVEFPTVFGNNFTSTAVVDTAIDTTVQIFDSIRVKRTLTHNANVDAYGNMTIPAGTFNSIRQQTQRIVIDSVWGWNGFTGWQNISAFNAYDTTYLYQWFASGEKYPIVEIVSLQPGSGIVSAAFKLGNNLLATIIDQQDVLCNGDCNGTAEAQAITGTPPFNYYWDTNTGSQTGPVANNLCPNTYFVTVVDGNNDSVLTSVVISEPPPLLVNLDTIITETDPGNNGGVQISVIGGSPPYTYSWDNGETTQDLSGLAEGSYSVTVTDLNGCTATGTYTVDSKVSVEEFGKRRYTLFPNPASDELVILSPQKTISHVVVYDMIGNELITKPINGRITLDVSTLPNGVYFIQLYNKGELIGTEKLQVVH